MRSRHRVNEIMDGPGIDRTTHFAALRGLARINRISGTASRLWEQIERACKASGGRTIRVLDLACGGGDVTRAIARRASGLPIEVHGADISEQAIEFASGQARQEGLDIRFLRLDALAGPVPRDYDILISTLFLHHLSDRDAAAFVGSLADATLGLVLIDDLVRSRLGYAMAWAGCKLLSRSAVVHHDGPASVRAAFRVEEVRALAEAAGLSDAIIVTHWPQRFLLSWSRR